MTCLHLKEITLEKIILMSVNKLCPKELSELLDIILHREPLICPLLNSY